jgi:nitrous oxidase accessory protein
MQKNLVIGISVVAVCVVVCASYSSIVGVQLVKASNNQKIEKESFPMFRGNTLYVGGSGPGNYSKIQDAVNASSDGDTVFVFKGSYYGKVLINKSISVLGENASRTFINYTYEPDWHSYVILISSHDVLFSGFTVVLEQGDGALLRLKDSRNCTISHNIFRGKEGMYLINSSYTFIENNSFFTTIYTISSYGIIKHNWFTNGGIHLDVYANENVISDNYFYHCYDNAILSYSPYRNIIERNVIRQNISSSQGGIEIYLYYSDSFPPGNIIRENDISGCDVGIATKGDYFTIEDNFVHDNDWGMELFTIHFYHVTVSNNTFLNDNVGLDLQEGMYGSVVERNVFHDCGAALNLYQCNGLTVQYNNLTGNSRAVYSAESKSNVISKNNFIGNHRYVLSIFSRDIWSGNYWDEPRSLPKLILGILPFIQFDWHPAQHPN